MVAAHRPKPLDKQELCRKVTNLLKKTYHTNPGKQDRPVLETVSRALSKLQKLGLISIKGRRVGIPSVARLGAFLRGEALPPAAPAPVALCA